MNYKYIEELRLKNKLLKDKLAIEKDFKQKEIIRWKIKLNEIKIKIEYLK